MMWNFVPTSSYVYELEKRRERVFVSKRKRFKREEMVGRNDTRIGERCQTFSVFETRRGGPRALKTEFYSRDACRSFCLRYRCWQQAIRIVETDIGKGYIGGFYLIGKDRESWNRGRFKMGRASAILSRYENARKIVRKKKKVRRNLWYCDWFENKLKN